MGHRENNRKAYVLTTSTITDSLYTENAQTRTPTPGYQTTGPWTNIEGQQGIQMHLKPRGNLYQPLKRSHKPAPNHTQATKNFSDNQVRIGKGPVRKVSQMHLKASW